MDVSSSVVRGVLVAQLVATLLMSGVIWFVQLVHYPLFAAVGEPGFKEYERRHRLATTALVGPLMLVEAVTSGVLLVLRPAGVPGWMLWVGAGIVMLLWTSTALVQVPCHDALSMGFNSGMLRRLVNTNWIRTMAWSARAALVLWMTWRGFEGTIS